MVPSVRFQRQLHRRELYGVRRLQIALPAGCRRECDGNAARIREDRARRLRLLAHGYSTGDSVTIGSATCSPTAMSKYNTTATIFNLTPTTFDYSYSATAPLPVASNSGITSSTRRLPPPRSTNLLKWVRGQDTQNENGFQVAGADTDVRASIHGDILHSRPVSSTTLPAARSRTTSMCSTAATTVCSCREGRPGGHRRQGAVGVHSEGILPGLEAAIRQFADGALSHHAVRLGATKRTYAWDGPVVSYIERNSSVAVTKAYSVSIRAAWWPVHLRARRDDADQPEVPVAQGMHDVRHHDDLRHRIR